MIPKKYLTLLLIFLMQSMSYAVTIHFNDKKIDYVPQSKIVTSNVGTPGAEDSYVSHNIISVQVKNFAPNPLKNMNPNQKQKLVDFLFQQLKNNKPKKTITGFDDMNESGFKYPDAYESFLKIKDVTLDKFGWLESSHTAFLQLTCNPSKQVKTYKDGIVFNDLIAAIETDKDGNPLKVSRFFYNYRCISCPENSKMLIENVTNLDSDQNFEIVLYQPYGMGGKFFTVLSLQGNGYTQAEEYLVEPFMRGGDY